METQSFFFPWCLWMNAKAHHCIQWSEWKNMNLVESVDEEKAERKWKVFFPILKRILSEWKVFRFFRIFFSFYFVNIFPNSGEQTRVSILAGLTFSIFRLHECARVCVLLCVREASKFENDSGHKCTQHTADIPSTGRIPSVFRRAFFSLSRCCKNSVIRMCWLGASC